MAGNYAQLLDIINNPTQHGLPAWDNNAKQIEGETVQQYLLYLVNSLTVGYQFMGVATPSTTPGTPDQNVFYIGGAGTYANFGTSITVRQGQICIFAWNGSWTNTPIEFANLEQYVSKDVFDKIIETKSINLFNKDSEQIIHDAYLDANGDVQILPTSGYIVSNFIKIDKDTIYCFEGSSFLGGGAVRVWLYDSTYTYLEMIEGTQDPLTALVSFSTNVEGVKYVRFNTHTSIVDRLMFTLSPYPPIYVPYKKYWQLTDDTLISDKQYRELTSILSGNPLSGKKIAFEGDSICYGYGYLGGYGKIIADRNNMSYYNGAVSGSKLVGDIDGRITSMPNDADYYIIEGGVNDYAANEPVGTVEPWGYALNPNTISGALQSIADKLYSNFDGKKYGFIFVHGVFQYGSEWMTTVKPMMKNALKKWGIPFIDMEDLMPPLVFNNDWKNTYTDNGDGWHPNQLGYETWYCDKIEAWLKTL